MSVRAAARRAAAAVARAQATADRRRGPGRYQGIVLDTDPLRVDVLGVDLELDATDVTLGRTVVAAGVSVGDVLVLVEVGDDAFVAVDVESA